MGSSRQLQVLSAIVSDYVNNREPVGSKALVERYDLGVSSATIRNDMAALEEAGYIYQPPPLRSCSLGQSILTTSWNERCGSWHN